MMHSGIWDRHSNMMEENSATEKERISATYHNDSEKNGGTSLQQLGDKELKSSLSDIDVSVDSAYTSSNKLSSAYFSPCPDRSFTDSGKACSLDSHQSETSCNEELLDSEETVHGPSVKCTSTPKFSASKDRNLYFQRNYTIFKEHMEPSSKLMDEIIGYACRDKSFPERIREAPTRERKADILIKYAARYLHKDSFENLLTRTEHGHLIQKLKTGSSQEACRPTAIEFEHMIHLLCNKQFKELLMDEIEPRLIIDRLVEHEVLSFDDHEDVLVTDYRPTRVESLMKYINRNHERNCIYFFMVLKESYPYLIHQFDTCDIVSGCEDMPNLDITKMNGGWKLPQSFSVDESAELKFHVMLSPQCPDVEMSIVNESSETSMDVEYNMKLLDLQLESMQLGSIVVVYKQLTAHAIQKLQEACSTGEIERYIRSLFRGSDVEQLRRDGVTSLVLKITAEKSHQDTTWMVTGRKLHENASFLLDELEPKEYVKAFDSILSQDVQSRLISDLDRRERAKLFLDEIVENGQPAVEIFICELNRLGRHHILNILNGTNTSGSNADRIAYQIRNSIVKNYSVFLAELEPKIIGTFFVERRLLDNALYEKICQHPSRRNRVITFLKWLLDEERPDAYFAFQNAVKMFYSKSFVKLLETTDPLSTSGISSRAADQTNDVAHTPVLLYLARFKITFSNALKKSESYASLSDGSAYISDVNQLSKPFGSVLPPSNLDTHVSQTTSDSTMEPDLVIALDIGTTYSGYACQFQDTFKTNPSEIWMNNSWGKADIANKTKTCLLLKSNEEIVSIGDKAEFEFFQMYDQDRDLVEKDYLFFKNFKLILYKEISEDALLAEDYFSRRKSIKLVMSKFIEGLVKHCIERFTRRRRISISDDKVRWVITVPAIWNENAKSVMRKAAEMAGIPGNQLVLALEPEAAAVNCLYLSVQERSGLDDLGRVGDKFMVIDLGGGTIDITAVEVIQNIPYNRLKEIVGANGGAWGGQRVNEAFQQACHDTFKTKDGKSVFIKCKMADLLKMKNEFERQKLNIVEGNPEWIEFQLSHDIRDEIMKDVYQEPNRYSKYFKITKNGLFFNSEIIRDVLFQETLKMTVQHIHEQMSIINAAHVRKFILVGGFAESPIVIEEMQKQFPDKKIFVVINPSYAVLRGAVLFGHEPNILQSRISRFTFGVKTHVDFDPNVHPPDKRWVSKDGKIYAKDIFSIHVKTGETVSIGETRLPVEYVPVYPDQTSVRLNVYQSTEKEPMYVTDPSCKKLGYLDVTLLEPIRADQNKKVEVSMVYGGTELTVKGVEKSFDIPYIVTIKFAHEN